MLQLSATVVALSQSKKAQVGINFRCVDKDLRFQVLDSHCLLVMGIFFYTIKSVRTNFV